MLTVATVAVLVLPDMVPHGSTLMELCDIQVSAPLGLHEELARRADMEQPRVKRGGLFRV